MNIINNISNFFMSLMRTNSKLSSNRFLAVFIFTPALLFTIFFKFELEYIYTLSGLITALLIGNAVGKHKNFDDKLNDNDIG